MARTFGVEEELLLVDPVLGRAQPAAADMLSLAAQRAGADGMPVLQAEFKKEQAEIGSDPTDAAEELLADLRGRRRAAAELAAQQGVQIAAVATCPYPVRPTASDDERYVRMSEEFGLVARQQLTCGQHVHVGVDSRDEGVAVLDRIAPYLSVLLAVSVNSPFWQGHDTGYASYRTLAWGLWPTAVPTGGFGDLAGYDAALADLLASGAALDDGMIYLDARLSARYPTVEIRVADVCTDVQDAVLIAVLCRALVEWAVGEARSGRPAPAVRSDLLRAAGWRAARHGLTDTLLDVPARVRRPAFDVLDQLLLMLTPVLAGVGDLELARAGVDRLRRRGTGAALQRSEFDRSGDLSGVVRDLVERTLA